METVMDLILEVRTGRESVTMACHGKLIGGREADAFRRNALLMMNSFEKLTINLAGIRAVDCAGLGSLASVLALAVDKGKRVRITHPSPLIVEMLHLAGLAQFLEFNSNSEPQFLAGSREGVA